MKTNSRSALNVGMHDVQIDIGDFRRCFSLLRMRRLRDHGPGARSALFRNSDHPCCGVSIAESATTDGLEVERPTIVGGKRTILGLPPARSADHVVGCYARRPECTRNYSPSYRVQIVTFPEAGMGVAKPMSAFTDAGFALSMTPSDPAPWGLIQWGVTAISTALASAFAFGWRLSHRLATVESALGAQGQIWDAGSSAVEATLLRLAERLQQVHDEHSRIRETVGTLPTRSELRDVEDRIIEQLSGLTARVDRTWERRDL